MTRGKECPRCQERGKTWEGSDPKCAFMSGSFNSDNWKCATLDALRRFCWDAERAPDDACGVFYCRHDAAAASLGVVLCGQDDAPGFYVVMSWYKDRGRVGQSWVFSDDAPPHPLTLEEADRAIWYQEKEDAPFPKIVEAVR